MLVKLTYFKPTGKYYAIGEYETQLPAYLIGALDVRAPYLHEIWAEVAEMIEARRCPGLVEGHSHFLVSVDVPDHSHNHPHLIWPQEYWQMIRDYEESKLRAMVERP